MTNPCRDPKTFADCPNRAPGCSVNCEKWAKYVEEREKIYNARKEYHATERAVADIRKNRVRMNRQRRKNEKTRK